MWSCTMRVTRTLIPHTRKEVRMATVEISEAVAAICRDALSDWVDRNQVDTVDASWPVVYEAMQAYHRMAAIAGYPANT